MGKRSAALSRTAIGFVALTACGAAAIALGEGCQDPTQVTLSLSLDKKAQCREISLGTAITVGVEPTVTEQRVYDGYVTAKTNDCDVATNMIGTLVITPNDDGRAAVIVVVGYSVDPTMCHPPDYKGCIVARRRFAFSKHERLTLPINIDPDCADVPCDAFSTCNNGQCFDSETDCSAGGCERPGELPDGAIDEGGAVIPDANNGFDGTPHPSDGGDSGSSSTDANDGSTPPADTGTDGPPPIDAGPQTYCTGTTLICGNIQCSITPTTPECCPTPPNGSQCQMNCAAPEDRLCCSDNDCTASYKCSGGNPGTCVYMGDSGVNPPIYPYCLQPSDTLVCNPSNACTGSNNACCGGASPPTCTLGSSTCGGNVKYCCQASDCPGGKPCMRLIQAGDDAGLKPAPQLVPGLNAGTCSP